MKLAIFNGYKQIGELQINDHEIEEEQKQKKLREALQEHPIG